MSVYQRLVAAMLESSAVRALRGSAPRASAGNANASGPVFDAFISYKQAADRAVAVGVQRVLQSLGIPWWRRRAMHVFRDDTTLVPSSALWESIQKALQASRNLILMA